MAKTLTGEWHLRINEAGELVMTVIEENNYNRSYGYSHEAERSQRDGTIADVVTLGRMGRLGHRPEDYALVNRVALLEAQFVRQREESDETQGK